MQISVTLLLDRQRQTFHWINWLFSWVPLFHPVTGLDGNWHFQGGGEIDPDHSNIKRMDDQTKWGPFTLHRFHTSSSHQQHLNIFTLTPVELQRQVRVKTMEHTELRSGLGRCKISTESRGSHHRSTQPTCPTTIPDREAFPVVALTLTPNQIRGLQEYWYG